MGTSIAMEGSIPAIQGIINRNQTKLSPNAVHGGLQGGPVLTQSMPAHTRSSPEDSVRPFMRGNALHPQQFLLNFNQAPHLSYADAIRGHAERYDNPFYRPAEEGMGFMPSIVINND
ncbi:hypothetical protein GOP47_0029710 [Adiantum capillus-veneris]|nr:hypothetical protein GOP47_0029710 [Adiantum capillus-veneris]